MYSKPINNVVKQRFQAIFIHAENIRLKKRLMNYKEKFPNLIMLSN